MNEALIDAVKRGDADAVAQLLDDDPSLLAAKAGNIPLTLLALYHGHATVAQLFVARGAELSFPEACALGDEARVRELLERDPSLLDRKSDDGFPPLGLAIFFRQPAMARLLIERGADVDAHAENAQRVAPLHAAAAVCDRETAALLLERGADPNTRQDRDFTPLHGAASRGDVELGRLLIAHGADAKAVADRKTPAEMARELGQGEFAEWLDSVAQQR
ncbi:MAG: ankyrin [Acidobacteria bacterium]|nr:ankyrin [Acidobacteriota bacterium]